MLPEGSSPGLRVDGGLLIAGAPGVSSNFEGDYRADLH